MTEPNENPVAGGCCPPATGSVSLTYAELEALLQNCRRRIESAPDEDPPAGYEALPPEQAEIADACWRSGMQQLSTALLNYWFDHGAEPPSPNTKLTHSRVSSQTNRKELNEI